MDRWDLETLCEIEYQRIFGETKFRIDTNQAFSYSPDLRINKDPEDFGLDFRTFDAIVEKWENRLYRAIEECDEEHDRKIERERKSENKKTEKKDSSPSTSQNSQYVITTAWGENTSPGSNQGNGDSNPIHVSLWAEFDLFQNGKKGMNIHIGYSCIDERQMTIYGNFYFNDSESTPLYDYNGMYCSSDGRVQLQAYRKLLPLPQLNELTYFMPYDELHLMKGKTHCLYLQVSFWDNINRKWLDIYQGETFSKFYFSIEN